MNRPAPWILLFLFGAVSCAGQRDDPATRVAARLLPAGSERLSSQAVFWDESEVFSWRFDTPEAVAAWEPERIDGPFELRHGGLYLRSSSPDPSLARECAIDAAAVRAIRVAHSGLTSGAYMQVFWSAAGEPFAEQRSLSIDRADPTGTLVPTYTFAVGRHQQWAGAVARFRLDPTSVANRQTEVYSVTGLAYTPSGERIRSLAQRAWRVDLAGDVRRAVLAPPGFPFVREVDVPPHATLRLAFGLEPGVSATVRFRVVIEEGEAATSLLDERIGPSLPGSPVPWQQRTIDLGPFAGRRVRLRFETESAEDLDLFQGFPSFAGLELVARGGPHQRRPNVILVVLDTLRADRLSLSGYGRPTSPRLDAWARTRGVVFERVVAPAPWTLPSHASLFTGLDGLVHGAHTDEPVSEHVVTLAERLRDAGYVTYAVTGGGYLASEYGLMQGFERVSYHFEPRVDPEQTGNDIESGMDRALSWLGTLVERPFFLLFHSYETHSPYRAREPYFQRFRGGPWTGEPPQLSTAPREPRKEEGFVITAWLRECVPGPVPGYRPVEPEQLPLLQDLYDSSVAFADQQVGRLLDRLVQLGLDDDTVVVITSDHGESLGERGLAGHSSLQECELLVPLIVATPSRQGAGTRVSAQVRLLDVAPTVLDLLDLEPLEGVAGRSLVPLLSGHQADIPDEAWAYAGSSNFGLGLRLANRLKYTYNNSPWPPIKGREALYRLDEDPGERTNIANEDPRATELRRRAREHYETSTSGLRVSIANRESAPLEAVLKGRIVAPLQVKAFDFGGTEVDWRGQSFRFALPPGEDARLFFEGGVFGELLVSVGFPGSELDRAELRRIVKLDLLEKSWQAILTDGEWVDDPSGDLARMTGVRVAIDGDYVRLRRRPGGIGQELREQLRILGYAQ